MHKLSRKELLAKILRVDHIGELAAIRIYDGQKAVISGYFFVYSTFFFPYFSTNNTFVFTFSK
ncbi:unnamed protein product [Brugia timori]|uniref:Uncharacterized protein n=1 Tax=Brugia timori TaxID=42155 RepID=A0A0R3QU06_9BILA|nr:unnamed protein product [Brugia timori]